MRDLDTATLRTVQTAVMTPTAAYVVSQVFPAAALLLPEAMNAPAAWRVLTAIGLQESQFAYRKQTQGPAVGFWQFEQGGGVLGVLNHPETREIAASACDLLCYKPSPAVVYRALEHNDVLAAVFARLLLWTDPSPLPLDVAVGWDVYLSAWRPGKPRYSTWNSNWDVAHADWLARA